MKTLTFDQSRVLILATVDEIARLPRQATPFAVLLATGAASPTAPETQIIEGLAQSNCREMCFAGATAESLHDLADDVVEERGLLEIVTTWLTNETPEGVASYFIECAGGVPPLLLAAAEHDSVVRTSLETAVAGRLRRP